jgi:hypothetical protein
VSPSWTCTARRVTLAVPDGRPRCDAPVGEDDLLCTRWRACLSCGKRDTPLDQVLITLGTRCLAPVRWLRRASAAPYMTALRAFLAQRYREETR